MRTKNKIISFVLACLMLVALSSCAASLSASANNDKTAAENYIERLFLALETEDKELLKDVFSLNAQSEAKEIDKETDHLMDLFGGKNLTYTNELLVSSTESNDHGDKVIIIDFHLNIRYDENEEYGMYFYGCRQDDNDKDNEGLTSLCVYLKKDEYSFGYNENHQSPGIEIFKNG